MSPIFLCNADEDKDEKRGPAPVVCAGKLSAACVYPGASRPVYTPGSLPRVSGGGT